MMMKHVLSILLSLYMLMPSMAQVASWKATGPIKFPTNVSGQIHGIGRVTQMKFHPTNSKKLYATSASGGLWYSADEGANWVNLGTDLFPQGQSASICIDHSNDQILYYGTGDPNYYGSGTGVWKTTDGGKNWVKRNTGMGNVLVDEIIMHPSNTNTLVAVTNNGIYKSTDGATTWTQKKAGGTFTSMELKPGSSSVLYAATHSEFWRSADFGDTWTKISIPGSGISNGGRIAVTPNNSNLVYLTYVGNFDENNLPASTSTPVLKSTDSGLTFSIVKSANSTNLNGYDASSGGQGNYNYGIGVDPTNQNTVYIVGHVVWKSTNGGVNWTKMTDWWAKCHTDMHQISVSPYNTSRIYNMNDGGIFLSTNGGTDWTPFSDGIEATECYHGAQSQVAKQIVSIGTQDNGGLYFQNGTWYTNRGGDWGSLETFDYASSTVYYHENGNRKTLPSGGERTLGWPTALSDGKNNITLAFNASSTNTAFASYTNIYRTTNLSNNPPTWTQILSVGNTFKDLVSDPSNVNVLYGVTNANRIYRTDNALATTPTFVNYATPGSTGSYAKLAVIKNNPNVVYMSNGNKVYRSSNKGQNWTEISTGLSSLNIVDMVADHSATDESVYIATAQGVYYKNASLNSWVNYSQGLPTIANINDLMVYNDGTSSSVLRVAYYGRGVFESPLYKSNGLMVEITNVVDGSSYISGNTINVSINATSVSTQISKVELYLDGAKIGEDVSSSYQVAWTNPTSGQHTLYAKVIDAGNASALSGTIKVTILSLRTPENPTPTINGVISEYYPGDHGSVADIFTASKVSTACASNFDYGQVTEDRDYIGFKFSSYIDVPTDGIYTFYTSSDDGSKLYIGTTEVVDNDGLHGMVEASGTVALKAGKHAIRVDYFEGAGGEGLEVRYQGPGINKQLIPSSVLYVTDALRNPENPSNTSSGIEYSYYEGTFTTSMPNFSGLTPVKKGTTAQITYSNLTTKTENIAFEYTGYIQVPTDGIYKFYTTSDDGTFLFIGSTKIVFNDGIHGMIERCGAIGLKAGKHAFKVQFYQGVGGHGLEVRYEGPNITKQIIPGNVLYYVSPNTPPTVQITSPTNNATVNSATVTVNATASDDVPGSVAKVEFYSGNTKVGEDTQSPYSVQFTVSTSGSYSLTAVATDNLGAQTTSAAVSINVIIPQSPYSGTAIPIPGKVEAEHYDKGGMNMAYFDNSSGNSGAAFRTDDVDVEDCTEGGYNIGYVVANEWVEYTVNITQAGSYDFEWRVASTSAGNYFHAELDGVTIVNQVMVPNTGGWQQWQSVQSNNVSLTTGVKVLRLYMDKGDFNLNYVNVMPSTVTSVASASALDGQISVFPNPTDGLVNVQVSAILDPNATISVVDPVGKVIIDPVAVGASNTIDLSMLTEGVYFVQVKTGSLVSTKKVMVSRSIKPKKK